MALTTGPFGSYPDVTGTVDATAKSEITANFNALKALIPDGSDGSSPAPHPDFDPVRPEYAVKLLAEIDALNQSIQNA